MTTLTSATWRQPGLAPEASPHAAGSSKSRRNDLDGRNVRNAPINADRRRPVEVSVQTSVEVRVEGAGPRWERTSANREHDAVPDERFFGSGPPIGNLTGKVTGNPEAHDRRAVANGRFDRQSFG